MALLKMDFYSDKLKRFTTVHVVLPNDTPDMMTAGNPEYARPMKVLYLLHGFSGYSMDWLIGCGLQDLSVKYNLAMVLPSGDNSFYVDREATGCAYGSFVGEELIQYITKTIHFPNKKEDTFVGGLSMGGFGAIRLALRYPDNYGKVFGLSSAMLIKQIEKMQPGEENPVANYAYFRSVFGDLRQLEISENNPLFLLKKLKEQNQPVPPIYMACGTEDFLLEDNRDFVRSLQEEAVDVEYHESEGTHNWEFWNGYLEKAIQWLLKKEGDNDKTGCD